jgi:hypothetical protein
MSLPEPNDRNPYFTVGIVGALRFKGKSYEEIAESLHFNSVEEMRVLLESWELPGWLVGAEANSGRPRVREKSTTRLRDFGPGKVLPPASNVTEIFKERLGDLLKSTELLKHINERLHGRYFARTNVETADVLHIETADVLDNYSPDDQSLWETDVLVRLPGGVELSPSEIEVTLIGVYVLADGRMDLLLEALHPDPPSVSAETWGELEGKRNDLKLAARQLAIWVRGSEVRRGRPSELSEMDHAVASITTKYRKDGLTDEEITRKLTHLEKDDGTSYTLEDVTELGDLGDLGLIWS